MGNQHSGRLTIFQAAAVDDPALGHAAFRVLACLGTYSDERGWCFPKQKTIADRLRITQQAVSKSLVQLRDLGYIQIHQTRDGRGMRAGSRYRLMLDHFPAQVAESTIQPDVVTQQPDVVPVTTPEVVSVTTSEVVTDTTPEVVTLTSQRERPKRTTQTKKSGVRVRATLATYQPSENLLSWVDENCPDIDLDFALENWRDWHTAKGDAIRDYDASLRTWLRKERPESRPRAAHLNGRHESNQISIADLNWLKSSRTAD